ncbi:unnamed protein product [Urochloa humidicola]
MRLKENIPATINEYGTNLFKSKSDPLVIIEAKSAIYKGALQQEAKGKLSTIMEEAEEVEQTPEANIFPSPRGGSQEAPVELLSSQEEMGMERETQIGNTHLENRPTNFSPEWDGLLAEVIEEEGTQEERNGSVQKLHTEQVQASSVEERVKELKGGDGQEEDREIQQGKEVEDSINSVEEKDTLGATEGEQVFQEQETRQSKRIRDQGLGNLKALEKAEVLAMKKNLEELQKEEDVRKLGAAAEAIKTTALQFHPRETGHEDTGVVLLH